MKLKSNLVSIGDTVKNKLGGLFGSLKNNNNGHSSPPQLPESPESSAIQVESGNSNITGNGRVFGRAAGAVINENHRPFKNSTVLPTNGNDDSSLSRSTSPNPFKMASSGFNRQSNFKNSNASPFARFDGVNNNSRNSPQPPSDNIFGDI